MNRYRYVAPTFLAVLFILAPWRLAEANDAPQYVGAKKCKACHLKQFATWSETKMAKSFELLKPGVKAEAKIKAKQDPKKDYTHDAKCLACHSTGYGKPGGFRSIEETPELAGVQCESCHGPHSEVLKVMTVKNKNYKMSEVLKAGLVVPDENTCKGMCHNSKSPFVPPGYSFDYAAKKKQGTHEHIPLKYQHH